jgi:hypothetical protein
MNKDFKDRITEEVDDVCGCLCKLKCWEFMECNNRENCRMGSIMDPNAICWLEAGDQHSAGLTPTCKGLIFGVVDTCTNCPYYRVMEKATIAIELLKKLKEELAQLPL